MQKLKHYKHIQNLLKLFLRCCQWHLQCVVAKKPCSCKSIFWLHDKSRKPHRTIWLQASYLNFTHFCSCWQVFGRYFIAFFKGVIGLGEIGWALIPPISAWKHITFIKIIVGHHSVVLFGVLCRLQFNQNIWSP